MMPLSVHSPSRLPRKLTEAWSYLAWRAMLTEVNLSPKPGLVDRFNNGAHKDMTLADFHRSARAIRAWFPCFIEQGANTAHLSPADVLNALRETGIACEAAMFAATGGVNTHKGSVFSLGLLCAALGRCYQQQRLITAENLCSTVAEFCKGLTARELSTNNPQRTAGQRLYRQLGLTGARGEAEAGFPLVLHHALPRYRALQQQGLDSDLALLETLLLLMTLNGDTNVASRGGAEGLCWLQLQAKKLLHSGGIQSSADLTRLQQFDKQCIERNLSPGGSADLLIITWFLAHLSTVSYPLYEFRRVTHVSNKR